MYNFSEKKILFIGPKTFNYEIEIKNELETLGAEVTYFSDKPFKNIFLIALLRLTPNILWLISKKIFLNKIKFYNKNYFDVVFIIKGEGISPGLLEWLKESNENATFILYLWDSIKNVRLVEKKFQYFDRILSFDPVDCKNYPFIIYRPLFFINDYKNKYKNKGDGLFFLGTLNGDRRIVISKINNYIKNKVRFDYSLLVRSNIELYVYKIQKFLSIIIGFTFHDIPLKNLIRTPMNVLEINSKISNCNAVLDIQHIKQSGLTMRTFEVLASGKKLITTNFNIYDHDFYDPTLIAVIDRSSPKIDLEFINSDSNKIEEKFYLKYSCSGWLKDIFNNNN